jgi:hypothetical protein
MILHLSQIFFTDARTFINSSQLRNSRSLRFAPYDSTDNLLIPVNDAAAIQVIGRKFDSYLVPGQDADEILAHFAGDMGQDLVLVFEFYLKHGVGQRLDHRCHDLDRVFFAHRFLTIGRALVNLAAKAAGSIFYGMAEAVPS